MTVKSKPLTKISLNTKQISLNVGEEKEIIASTTPTVPGNPGIYWKTDNAKVAIVDQFSGVVTAISPGNAGIMAITNDVDSYGNHLTAYCKVIVADKPDVISILKGKTRYNDAIVNLQLNKSISMKSVVTNTAGVKCFNQDVYWESDDPSVAMVSSKGKITALSNGIEADTPVTWTLSGSAGVMIASVDTELISAIASTAAKKHVLQNRISEWKKTTSLSANSGELLAIKGTNPGRIKLTATVVDPAGKTKKVSTTITVKWRNLRDHGFK